MGSHRTNPTPFVNSFTNPTLGSLRYNTAQAGSPVPIVWGTQRVGVNLLEFFNYQQHNVGSGKWGGKGGLFGGGSSSGGKKGGSNPPQFTVCVVMAVCQGPVTFSGAQYGLGGEVNRIWANAGVGFGPSAAGLTNFLGYDGQDPDANIAAQSPYRPVLGYSGVCVLTGAPLDLGTSPSIPNVSLEVTGFGAGTAAPDFPDDCNPGWLINDFLTNPRYGAGFPAEAIDQIALGNFSNYCAAFQFAMSKILERCEPAARTIEEICTLTVAASVWSGATLKIIPYSTIGGSNSVSGISWSPNVTPVYTVDDRHFIDFGGGSDPVLMTISDPAHINNWLSVEYQDRQNNYNTNIVYDFDQAAIDRYGVRPTAVSEAHSLCNVTVAGASAKFQMARLQGNRKIYKFQLPWTFALLEPMDVMVLNDPGAGIDGVSVRITSVEEDDNNVLVFEAEEVYDTAINPLPRQSQIPSPDQPQVFAQPGSAF
jgi:hypothetical protein